jgi:hypothetical protein
MSGSAQAEAKPSKLEEFRQEVIGDRRLIVHLTTVQTILEYLKRFQKVMYWERIYHTTESGIRWVRSEDDPEDHFTSRSYLKQYGKRYAKYKVYHPEMDFPLDVFKYIDDTGKSFMDEDYDMLITLQPGQTLPKGLL